MFQLHDRTRRQIGTLAFVVLCLVPTAVVLAYGLAWHLPGHVRHEAQRLSALLGLKVSLEGVEHLRPGVARYVGLELVDAETQSTVLSCRQLEVAWRNRVDQAGQSRPCLLLSATEAELDADGLRHVWRLLQEMLTCRADRTQVDVRLSVAGLTLHLGETDQRLVAVEGSFDSLAQGSQADLRFHPAGAEKAEAVRIRVVRNRQSQPPVTGFALHTGGAPLPCSLLAAAFPWFEPLGTEPRFYGYFWANETPEGWDGGLTGQFFDVELGRLLDGRFPHTIRGRAQVTIEEAQFEQGRLERLVGSAVGGQGEVSRSLLDACVRNLGLLRVQEVPGPQTLLPYEQLGLAFSLDAGGLVLRGQCSSAGAGVILVDRYGPLLGQANHAPQPIAALVRTLVPTSEPQIPATREADRLLRRLPLPSTASAEATPLR